MFSNGLNHDITIDTYAGIDVFRMVAAILVIAIHTSPLSSLSATGDFLLTRAAARVAVPFFFMTSGFFLITRYAKDTQKLLHFIKRTCIIYLFSMLLYLPLNIYSGYFGKSCLLPELFRDIIFDGTFYHLWYLPAAMTGAAITWYLVRRHGWRPAFLAACVLYLIGLFGDSYYGFLADFPVAVSFYGLLFQVCSYTRNGIFFAPLFFLLGGSLARHRPKMTLPQSICGFLVCYLLLFGEALLLHHFRLQRHDSMYLSLVPCMYFGFCTLLHFRGKRRKMLGTLSLAIYLLHPLMIVFVRGIAKFCGLRGLLVDNSLLHFPAVTLCSVALGIAVCGGVYKIYIRSNRKLENIPSGTERSYIEINLANLSHNARVLQAALPTGCKLMAVVKADAYGHGAFGIATHLEKMGVDAFATATIDEAILLRKYGISGEILILGYTNPNRATELRKYNLMQTLVDFDHAAALNAQGIRVKAHLKIDTGMHRLGVDYADFDRIEQIFSMKNIKICGIYTHLSCADSQKPSDAAFTKTQIARFYRLTDALKSKGIPVPKIHIQSSYGFINCPELACDYVRAGLALYGIPSVPAEDSGFLQASATPTPLSSASVETEADDTNNHGLSWSDLRPVLSLKSRVVLIRSVKAGESIGYNRTYTVSRDSRIAVLPIGYADGLPRSLPMGQVLLRGQYAPIIGSICMDQLTIDVTDIADVKVGELAVLIDSKADDRLAAPLIAEQMGSISNELLSRLGARLPFFPV